MQITGQDMPVICFSAESIIVGGSVGVMLWSDFTRQYFSCYILTWARVYKRRIALAQVNDRSFWKKEE